ncbi:hypothetical protein ENINCK372B1_15285 [Enterobacter intestinihominis]
MRTAWREIQQATDMTLEMLNRVEWVQVLTDAATAIAVILVAVGVGRWAFLKPLSARFY